MTARIERLIDSPVGLNLAASLARAAQPRLGYAIAALAARWISSRRQSDLVRAVRSNQWVVAGEQLTSAALDQAVRGVFWSSARSIYELYHYLQDSEAGGHLFAFEPSVQALLHRPEFDRRGLVVVGVHLSGFDLALQWICLNWIKPLVLTLPNPEGGRRFEFDVRKKTGMNLVPGTFSGLRQALRHLKEGGMVVTGIDRPLEDGQETLRFFGRPACLPTHHVYLALKARVPVMVVISRMEDDGLYHVVASPPIDMDSYSDRQANLIYNGEKVLSTAEVFIRQSPQQWVITRPVWPEAISQVPG